MAENNDSTVDSIIKKWSEYINDNLLNIIGPKMEGNLYTTHGNYTISETLKSKQHNISLFFKERKPVNVLEIGFNAGFSAVLMSMSHPEINLTCVDINYHKYVVPCYERISEDYKIELIKGSSHKVLPELISQKKIYDVIHIDGDHVLESARKDIQLCLKLCKPGSIIILDDTNMQHINNLCNQFIKNGAFKELIWKEKITGSTYQHRFLQI